MNKEEIIKAIEEMTVLELSELVKELEERFGVSAAAPVAAMPMVAWPEQPLLRQHQPRRRRPSSTCDP
jgi:ribosomal protein L7/L12